VICRVRISSNTSGSHLEPVPMHCYGDALLCPLPTHHGQNRDAAPHILTLTETIFLCLSEDMRPSKALCSVSDCHRTSLLCECPALRFSVSVLAVVCGESAQQRITITVHRHWLEMATRGVAGYHNTTYHDVATLHRSLSLGSIITDLVGLLKCLDLVEHPEGRTALPCPTCTSQNN
jgi:hypothetical protein